MSGEGPDGPKELTMNVSVYHSNPMPNGRMYDPDFNDEHNGYTKVAEVEVPDDAMTNAACGRAWQDTNHIDCVMLELWWFQMCDAADLPEGAHDTYDRPIGFYDLPDGPGTYEFTYNQGMDYRDSHNPYPDRDKDLLLWATFRKVA